MLDYFIIPEYYLDYPNGINSVNLRRLLISSDPMGFLRVLYKEDINKFYSTRDELILRGINFKEEFQNNFFPYIELQGYPKIVVETNENLFLNVDFNLLGLPNFIQKFEVQNDLFFNNLPLEGFTILTKNITLEFVINVFKTAGFKITNDLIFDNKETKNLNNTSSKLSDIFGGTEFLAFQKFCIDNNYVYITDLSVEKIENFITQDYVGIGKVKKVLEKFNSYMEKHNVYDGSGSINNDLCFFIKNDFRLLCDKLEISYIEVIDHYFNESTIDELNNLNLVHYKETVEQLVEAKIQEINNRMLENLFLEYKSPLYVSHLSHMKISLVKELVSRKVNISDVWTTFDEDTQLQDISLEVKNIPLIKDVVHFQKRIKPVIQTIKEIKGELNEQQLTCIILRNDTSQTLETIGNHFNRTRERARQIIRRATNKIISMTNSSDFLLLFKIFTTDRLGITLNELSELLNIKENEDREILKCMLNSISGTQYLEFLNLYTTEKKATYLEQKISTINNISHSIVKVEEVISEFNTESEEIDAIEIDLESLDSIMESYKFNRGKDIYYLKSISLPDKITYLFKNYVKSAIRLDENGYDYLNNLMFDIFGEGLNSGMRATDARIRDTENIILTDRATFKYHDPYTFNESIMNVIEDYIDNYLQNHEVINVEIVYRDNLELMSANHIESKQHLYSLIQYYLNENYSIGKGNTLNIYKANTIKNSAELVLEKLLQKNGYVMSKSDALEVLHWPVYKLDQLIGNSSKFMALDNNNFILISSLNISEADKELVIQYLHTHLEKGYTFPYEIYMDMKFDDQLSNVLSKYNLKNHSVLSNLIKKLIPDLRGFSNFLYLNTSLIDSTEKLLIQTFPGTTSRNELKNFLIDKGYSHQAVYGSLREVIETRAFVESDTNTLINRTAIDFNDELKNSLKHYLVTEFESEEYLSISSQVGYRSKLPSINVGKWTKHLIYNLGIELGYKFVKTTSDYRYDKLVLLKPTSTICKYDELIHHVLTNKYEGSMHETEVASYLASIGLTNNSQKVSVELKSSPLFTFNELGWITLLGGVNNESK